MKRIFGCLCRVYGNEYTNLTLSDKAQAFYSGCSPLTIYEREVDVEDEDGYIIDTEYRYTMCGGFETIDYLHSRQWLTKDEINQYLEELADELAQEEEW